MRRLILLALTAMIALPLMAQNSAQKIGNIEATPKHEKQEINFNIPDERPQGSFRSGAALNIIWEEDFSNGIPAEWVNYGQGANGNTQQWEYRGAGAPFDTGTGTRGAYGNNRRIESFSWQNGFVIYDSDYYDNGGVPGDFGNGPAAAPQFAYLQTDTIDLSAQPEVVLEFYQYTRNFQSDYFVLISGDAGADWDTITVNDQIPTNVAGQDDEYEAFDISETCGGSSEVLVRFVYDANYYFWQLDDLRIIEKPDNDLAVTNAFVFQGDRFAYYGRNYSDQYTTYNLASNVGNLGKSAQPNATLDVEVLDSTGTAVYTNSSMVALLEPDSIEGIEFTDNFDPSAHGVGSYQAVYTASSDSSDIDPDPSGFRENNNMGALPFTLTENEYALDLGNAVTSLGTGSFTGGDDNFRMANLMELVQPDTITHVRVFLSSQTTTGGNYQVTIRDTSQGFGQAFSPGGNWPVVLQSELLTVTEQDSMQGFLDVEIPEVVSGTPQNRVLQPDWYFVTVELYSNGGDNPIRILDDASHIYNEVQPNRLSYASVIYLNQDQWYTNGSAFMIRPRFETSGPVGIADKELDIDLNVSPNPASTTLRLSATSEVASDYQVVITNISGKIAKRFNESNMTSIDRNIDVSDLASGIYTIQVKSDKGIATRKFVVSH